MYVVTISFILYSSCHTVFSIFLIFAEIISIAIQKPNSFLLFCTIFYLQILMIDKPDFRLFFLFFMILRTSQLKNCIFLYYCYCSINLLLFKTVFIFLPFTVIFMICAYTHAPCCSRNIFTKHSYHPLNINYTTTPHALYHSPLQTSLPPTIPYL